MRAELRFPTATAAGALLDVVDDAAAHRARVEGERGELRVLNPMAPQLWHRMTSCAHRRQARRARRARPTYEYQLDAFCDAVATARPR